MKAMIFYTADTHFRYEPMADKRPFGSVDKMDEALIANWNAVVSEDDTVYLLGDIGYNDGRVPCRILSRLNGRKHLIRGNHDTAYEDAPLLHRYFESVSDFLEIDDGVHHIFLSHYPMLYSKPNGYMIHGHLHGSGQFHDILGAMPRVLNAGVDVNDFHPVTLEQLIENNRRFYSEPVEGKPYHRQGKGLLPGKADFRPIPPKPAEHPKHLFLTGPKRIGKSTVLRRLLEERDISVGGFRTVRIKTENGASVHMIRLQELEFTDENRIFYRSNGELHLDAADFDRIGCNLLENAGDFDLVLMDELGPTEAEAMKFRQKVIDTLEGNVPVYGVLQMADSDFLDQVAAREDVQVIVVDENNRDSLPRVLLESGW